MSKVNSVYLTFKGPKPLIGGKWSIKSMPFAGGDSAAVVLFTAGEPGEWTATPGPFIITKDPKPAQVLTAVYDSTTMKTLGRLSSTSREAVAAYDDGLYNNVAEARRDYPNHEIITIAVFGSDRAEWADTEPGNMNPSEALQNYKAGFITKGIYASLHTWESQLIPMLHHGEFAGLKPLRWAADWTGTPHLPRFSDGVLAAACQYDNHVTGRVNTDVSVFTSEAL